MSETFTWHLRCPVCGREGEADLCEPNEEAWSQGDRQITVEAMTDGFTVVYSEDGELDFVCVDHPVQAVRDD